MSAVVTAEQPLDAAELWRRLRYPVALIVVGLGLVTLLAAVGHESNTSPLDPRSTAPDGAHALSVLLTERGVPVTVVTALDQLGPTPGTTILLSAPDEVSTHALQAVAASTATIVVVDPSNSALAALGVPASLDAQAPAETISPGCPLRAAITAGSIRVSGDLYAASGPVSRCYVSQGDAALLRTTRSDHATTIVLGSAATLSNAELATEGDAALGLGLLDQGQVRWVPGALDAAAAPPSHRGLLNLLPSRLLWATLQLFVMLVVLALWRSRRLGRPVAEPLPVVVRAAETVEGRARLMQTARARDVAARALREASILRLSRRLRLGADEDQGSVVGVIAERTGLAATEVDAVLYGGVPQDDAALVRLAQELPRLESAVRGAPTTGGQP